MPHGKPNKTNKTVDAEVTPKTEKNKRKSLPNDQQSAKKSKLARASMSKLKNQSGFIEEDM